MLRHRAGLGAAGPAALLYSTRTERDLLYREELDRLTDEDGDLRVAYTLTRDRPPGWTGYDRRIDADMLAEALGGADHAATVFVCGPTRFVEVAADTLVGLGYEPGRVRTERFGPSGR
jgi:ferredoxin-NADP reductase